MPLDLSGPNEADFCGQWETLTHPTCVSPTVSRIHLQIHRGHRYISPLTYHPLHELGLDKHLNHNKEATSTRGLIWSFCNPGAVCLLSFEAGISVTNTLSVTEPYHYGWHRGADLVCIARLQFPGHASRRVQSLELLCKGGCSRSPLRHAGMMSCIAISSPAVYYGAVRCLRVLRWELGWHRTW